MKLNIKNILKAAASLALSLISSVDARLSLRGAKNDVTEITDSGSITYRPDGTDSTLLCLEHFKVLKGAPAAYRMYDIAGEDQYPENFSQFISVGKKYQLAPCATDKHDKITRDSMIQCIDAIAAKKIHGSKSQNEPAKLIAERVRFEEECIEPAKPKNATVVKKIKDEKQKVNITVETQGVQNNYYYQTRGRRR